MNVDSDDYTKTKVQHLLENDSQNEYMLNIPPKSGRYIVLDTETTGMSTISDNIIELSAHEVSNGKITGNNFHIFLGPRKVMSSKIIDVHHISNEFYDNYFKNFYASDKDNMQNFLKFVGTSLIFAHNAPFDMAFINNELKFWKLPQIDTQRFRCTMRIFYNVFGKDPNNKLFHINLESCCEYFNLRKNSKAFHSADYDALMTAKVLCKIYDYLEMNSSVKKDPRMKYMSNSIDSFLNASVENKRNSNDKKYKNNKFKNKNIMNCIPNFKKRNFDEANIGIDEKDKPEYKFKSIFNNAKMTKKSSSIINNNKEGNINFHEKIKPAFGNKNIINMFNSNIKNNENDSNLMLTDFRNNKNIGGIASNDCNVINTQNNSINCNKEVEDINTKNSSSPDEGLIDIDQLSCEDLKGLFDNN